MADGVTLNAATVVGGQTVDTETNPANSRQIQRVKVVLGATDTDGGNVSSSNALPVVFSPPVGYAALNAAQSSVTASASLIVAARAGAPGTGRGTVQIFNAGANPCNIGGSGVTYGTGWPLLAGEVSPPMQTTAALYGICNTGLTTTVAFVELY